MLGRIKTGWSRLTRGVRDPQAELNTWQRGARYSYDLTRHAGRQLVRHRAPLLAAALAYRTLFSLVPVLVLVLVVLQQVYGPEGFRTVFTAIVDYLGLSELEVTIDGEAQTAQDALSGFINNAVDRVSDVSFTGIAAVGVLVFVYAAISLLIQIETAFNAAVETTKARAWLRKIPTYWTILTLGALLLPLSFFLGTYFNRQLDTLPSWAAFITTPVRLLLQWGTTWLVLIAAYMWMPTARVRLGPSAAGAAGAAVLWESGKSLLAGAVPSMFEGQLAIYGSLALLPMLLLWVYVTWLIVLFGLEVSYAIQTLNQSELRTRRHAAPEPTPVLGTTAMAGLAAHLARAFERGEAPTLASLARETGVTKAAAMHGLTALEDAGVARQVYEDEDGRTAPGGSSTVGIGSGDGGEGDSRWTLARPASRVSMTTVMDAMSRAGSSDAADDDLAMSAFRDRLSSALDDVTLAALIDDADAIAAERLQDAGRYDGRRRSGAPDGGRKDDAGEGDDDGDDGAEREGAGERSPTRERSGAGS